MSIVHVEIYLGIGLLLGLARLYEELFNCSIEDVNAATTELNINKNAYFLLLVVMVTVLWAPIMGNAVFDTLFGRNGCEKCDKEQD